MIKSRRLVVCLFSVLAAAGCGSRGGTDRPPVATPSVTLNKDRVAIGSPMVITYRFDVANRKIDGDYWVFAHVLDQEGERLWGDDHQPPVKTSSWQPEQRVEYTRTVFLPNYPYIGPAQMRIGLYMPSTGERLPLSGNEISRREYEVARLEILPQNQNVFLIYKEGWHPAEASTQDPTIEWQWTRKSAAISFRNPKTESTFYLEFDARTDLFSPPQQVTVRIADQVVGTFAADSREPKLVTLPLTTAQLGSDVVTELLIDIDRTFQPGGADTRELGIRVFHAFVEPQSTAPK